MRKHIRLYWENNARLIAWSVTLGIFVFSLLKPGALPVKSLHVSDKILHTFAYTVLMISWLFVYRKQHFRKYLVLFAVLSVFGIIIELLQAYMRLGRNEDLYDVLANTIGLTLGMSIFPIVEKLFSGIDE